MDLSQAGPHFTWTNNQDNNPISKKLDRVMGNSVWISGFPNSHVFFETGGVLEHSRMVTQLHAPMPSNPKPFKFFTHVVSHPEFLEVVRQVWSSSPGLFHSRSALKLFHWKLKMLKSELRLLNREAFGDLRTRVKKAYEDLCEKQNSAMQNPSTDTFEEASDAWEHWHHISGIEEQLFYQKSRVQWLGLGDRNTNFFHKTCQSRNSRNAIRRLVTADGRIITELEDIKAEAVAYYEEILQGQSVAVGEVTQDDLEDILDYRCTSEDAARLTTPVSAEEVRDALFSMPANKAPGPDGFPMEFYKAAWTVVGKDLITAIQSFFLFGFLPRSINATLLSLVPKTTTAEKMSDFRPIACCNVVYKIISRIMAHRLKAILPPSIELNQCAFVEGRLLLENVLLATELVKDYHKPSISSRSAVKLDISKAFDTVNWSFVEITLRAMNIPAQFVTWIMRCIDTATFSVSINGELAGFFPSSRGIRQGCSLSPYLYVIVSNVLSKLLNRAVLSRSIGYHPMCQDIRLTHLSFADDIVVFTDGLPSSLTSTLEVFQSFAEMSGLCINVAKSTVFAAGRGKGALEEAAIAAGLSVSALPIKYLELPLTTKTMTCSDYEPLLLKIKSRFQSWTSKALSFAGRLQLINSVIASVTNFWCSAFSLPQGCTDEIESMCSAFLRSGSPNITTKAKVAWSEVYKLKSEGGLGVRSIREVSTVFALKLIWRVFSDPGSLWVKWVNQVLLRNNSFWDAREGTAGSWVWRKLLQLRPLAKKFIRMAVHNGSTTKFWTDIWHPLGRLIEVMGEHGRLKLGINRNATISELLSSSGWRLRNTRDRHIQHVIDQIKALGLCLNPAVEEKVQWMKKEGEYGMDFSAKATWSNICTSHNTVPWHRLIWFSQGVPRYSFITWLAIKDRLSTGSRMRAWGIEQGCLLCGERHEDRDHLYFACPYTYTLWLRVLGSLLQPAPSPDWNENLSRLGASTHNRLTSILLRLALQVTIYYIWRERNERRHNQMVRPVEHLYKIIDKTIRHRILSTRYHEKPRLVGLLQCWFSTRSGGS